jgi:hypothetical protein
MAVAPIPFTPARYSVNRVRIVDLPGIVMDEGVRGQQAYHLASVLAMISFARARAADLQLPEAFFDDGPGTRSGLPRYIDASLRNPDPKVHNAAHAGPAGYRSSQKGCDQLLKGALTDAHRTT